MPTLGSTLQIAKTGLNTQQQAMNVVAHNIANASTEGYSRQRVLVETSPGLHTTSGVFGTGARVENVQRIGDALLDRAYYREVSAATEHETRANTLGRIEGLLGEPSDTGLAAAMDAFSSSWSELGSNPGSLTVRAAAREAGARLASTFQRIGDGLDAIRQEVEVRLVAGAEDASRLIANIARLNLQITIQESDGSTAGDLRDTRGRQLSELAGLLPIDVIERQDGSVGVTMSGISVVDGAYGLTLETRFSGGVWGISSPGRTGVFSETGGGLGGLLEVLNTDIPAVRQGLDDLAAALVAEVNALHTAGTNPTGTTGVSFFDPTGVTMTSIALSAAVLADSDLVAAGTPDGTGAYRAGANDIATALAGLRDIDIAALGKPFSEHYRGLVFDLGQKVRSSTDTAEVHRVLADQADIRRMQTSGVSLDEELVKMIEFQNAYQASARIITAVDEMFRSLLAV